MAQVLTGTGNPGRAMDQRQRTAANVRKDPVTNSLVITRELKLGDVEFGIDQAVRM